MLMRSGEKCVHSGREEVFSPARLWLATVSCVCFVASISAVDFLKPAEA